MSLMLLLLILRVFFSKLLGLFCNIFGYFFGTKTFEYAGNYTRGYKERGLICTFVRAG